MVFASFVPSAPRRETRDLAPSVAVGAGANAPSADIVSSAVVEDGWVDACGGVCEARMLFGAYEDIPESQSEGGIRGSDFNS